MNRLTRTEVVQIHESYGDYVNNDPLMQILRTYSWQIGVLTGLTASPLFLLWLWLNHKAHKLKDVN